MCKITQCVQSYTLCVKHTLSIGVPFDFILTNSLTQKCYTGAATEASDKYEVCTQIRIGIAFGSISTSKLVRGAGTASDRFIRVITTIIIAITQIRIGNTFISTGSSKLVRGAGNGSMASLSVHFCLFVSMFV